MGEYARTMYGEEVKIGTCENMLYLRHDQRRRVWALPGNVDPTRDAAELRYRFPWPDEDHVEPGGFDNPFRKRAVWGVTCPLSADQHYSVQFKADAGYLVSLPCPESSEPTEYTIHRNGFRGAVFISQQREWDGQLVTVCECACGAAYRLGTLADAEPILVALRNEADEQQRVADRNNTPGNASVAASIHAIADRITAGYTKDLATLFVGELEAEGIE